MNNSWMVADADKIVTKDPNCTFKNIDDAACMFWKGVEITGSGRCSFEFEIQHIQSICEEHYYSWDFIFELFSKYHPPIEIYVSDWHYEVCYDINDINYNVSINDMTITISKDSYAKTGGTLKRVGSYIKRQYNISDPSLIYDINSDFEFGLEICQSGMK